MRPLRNTFFLCIFFLVFTFAPSSLRAADLTSTNFIIRDPIIGTGGGYLSSTNFQLFGAGHTLFSDIGTGTLFIGRYGFLYYPEPAAEPAPAPAPGGGGGGGAGAASPTSCRITDFNCDGR